MCFAAHSRPRISWGTQQDSLEMLHYFTIKSLKSEVVVGDYADIFTLLPHVQIALIKEYICRKYPCYEVMQFVSVSPFLKLLCQAS